MPRAMLAEETFFLDRSDGAGLQSQIRQNVISGILSRRLLPGTRLPSTRKLAAHVGVSRITVALAYQELASQGYVEARARRAYVVADAWPAVQLHTGASERGDDIDWPSRMRATFSVAKTISKPLDWRSYRFPFVYGQMDPSLFDLAAWRDCSRRALAKGDFEQMAGDFAAADDQMLIDYICSHSLPRRGIKAGPENILVTVGAQNALWIVTQLFLDARSVVACENPCHPAQRASLQLSGARVVTVDIDEAGLPPERLPGGVDLVFVTPSHHSPTAVTMPMSRRLELIEAAHRKNFIVVEDDYEFEMSFLAPASPALRSIDRNGRVLYMGSFSKSIFPGLRLGYLVASEPVIREARALRALMLRHPPGHLQRTTAYFLALGHYDAVVRRMRNAYRARHEIMTKALIDERLKVAGVSPFGGTSFWIEGPPGFDSDAFTLALRSQSVLAEAGTAFFAGNTGPSPYFRMAYSSIAAERIPEGVARTAAMLRRFADGRQRPRSQDTMAESRAGNVGA